MNARKNLNIIELQWRREKLYIYSMIYLQDGLQQRYIFICCMLVLITSEIYLFAFFSLQNSEGEVRDIVYITIPSIWMFIFSVFNCNSWDMFQRATLFELILLHLRLYHHLFLHRLIKTQLLIVVPTHQPKQNPLLIQLILH